MMFMVDNDRNVQSDTMHTRSSFMHTITIHTYMISDFTPDYECGRWFLLSCRTRSEQHMTNPIGTRTLHETLSTNWATMYNRVCIVYAKISWLLMFVCNSLNYSLVYDIRSRTKLQRFSLNRYAASATMVTKKILFLLFAVFICYIVININQVEYSNRYWLVFFINKIAVWNGN